MEVLGGMPLEEADRLTSKGHEHVARREADAAQARGWRKPYSSEKPYERKARIVAKMKKARRNAAQKQHNDELEEVVKENMEERSK